MDRIRRTLHIPAVAEEEEEEEEEPVTAEAIATRWMTSTRL